MKGRRGCCPSPLGAVTGAAAATFLLEKGKINLISPPLAHEKCILAALAFCMQRCLQNQGIPVSHKRDRLKDDGQVVNSRLPLCFWTLLSGPWLHASEGPAVKSQTPRFCLVSYQLLTRSVLTCSSLNVLRLRVDFLSITGGSFHCERRV